MSSEDNDTTTSDSPPALPFESQARSDDVTASVLLQAIEAFAHQLHNIVSHFHASSELIAFLASEDSVDSSKMLKMISKGLQQQTQEITYWYERLRNTLGRHPGVLRSVDVQTVITDVRDSFPECSRGRIKLQLLPTPLSVLGDRELLWHLFENIIHNGLDAINAREDGKVHVTASVDSLQSTGVIVIQDNGTGISPKIVPRIFELNYTTKSHGLGVGLFIVQRAVHLHKGHIECHSEPGKGATFIVSLPLDKSNLQAAS